MIPADAAIISDPPYGMDLDTDYSKLPSTKKEGNKTYSRVIGDNSEFDPIPYLSLANEIILWGADYYADRLPKGGSWFVWDKRVDENFDKMIGSAFELCWSKIKHKREIVRCNNTLFSGEQDAKNKVHPTQKPIKVCVWFIEKLSKSNDLILDLFGGSGSTLIACEQIGRKCHMMELDPLYVDVIIKRWEKLTGKTATKI
jgi:tRNA G10  N-methylase Trm11